MFDTRFDEDRSTDRPEDRLEADAVDAALRQKPRRSVAAAQWLLGLGFLLLLVAVLSGVALWSYRKAFDDARETVVSLSRLVENQTERLIESADLMLIDMQRIARVANWSNPDVARLAHDELIDLAGELPHLDRLLILGPDGQVRATSDAPGQPVQPGDVRELLEASRLSEGRPYLSPTLRRRPNGQEVIVLSRPVAGPNGRFDGIVAVWINPGSFGSFFRSLNVRYDAIFELVHRNMTVLVREPPLAGGDWTPAGSDRGLLPQLAAGPAATEYLAPDGVERIGSVHRVGRYPLLVNVALSRPAVRDEWLENTSPYLSFAGFAIVALTLLLAVAVQRGRREDAFRIALLRSNALLEERVRERTRSLEEALGHKDILFKELNHRVKNNLQIVGSLLRLQSGKFADPAVVEGFRSCLGRISSMSAVHELLYRRDHLAHVDFGDYLKLLCSRMADSFGEADRIGLEVSADEDLLDVGTAIPLALFVNELVSNSFKHAFPDGRAGRIALSYRRDGEARRLVVEDDGVGMREEGGRSGALGLQLARALASQIGGDFRQEPGRPGTRSVLEFVPPPATD